MKNNCEDYLKTIELELNKLTHDETRTLAKIIAFHLGQQSLQHNTDLLQPKYINSMAMEDLCGKTQEAFTKGMDVLLKVADDVGKERVAGWSYNHDNSVLFNCEKNQILSRT